MMKRYKRCCLFLLCTLLLLVLYNALVWHFCTRQLLTRADGYFTGDLSRMGYLSAFTDRRRNQDDLPRRHLEMIDWQGQQVDVLTVGDSFSQGGGNGPNRYYQDYLASLSHVDVLNVGQYPGAANLLETVVILLNSGFLDKVRPRYLLLEIVERNCYKHAGAVDWARSASLEYFLRPLENQAAASDTEDGEGQDLPPVGFINTGNVKWLSYNLLYNFSANAFISNTYRAKLDSPFFGKGEGDTLLFLRKDIEKVKRHDPETVGRLNASLNRLASMLKVRGITLCFMPAPDKYTLYHPYLVRAAHAPSLLFPLLRPLQKEYRFIDSQAILAPLLARGEKDVYFIDDTHWSWKASQAIFTQEAFN
jgi:hypothetical protein